jgi:hypothetical protein
MNIIKSLWALIDPHLIFGILAFKPNQLCNKIGLDRECYVPQQVDMKINPDKIFQIPTKYKTSSLV